MTSEKTLNVAHAYPIAIIEDRYGGTYSHGAWIAIADADKRVGLFLDGHRMFSNGPWGDDLDAADFWSEPPRWVASGNTPEQAVENLTSKNG